jgi:DNA invertase Pin-like site-specific DNA recombinase
MQTLFTAIMPLRPVNNGPKGIEYQIHYGKLAEKYPNWDHANKYKTVNSVNQTPKKKSKSREEQREIFQKLLASGKVDTQAEIARKFDCSRAWVSKVLSLRTL